MLALNGVLVVALAVIFALPCLLALRRRNTPRFVGILLGVTALCAIGAGVGYSFAFNRVNNLKMHEYSWRLNHVADIAVDRNFRFKETHWPKDEYFADWLDFPVEEKRIQVNKTINARAYFATFIVADESSPRRWRPLQCSDLPNVLEADKIPELPLDRIQAYVVGMTAGDERSPVGYDKKSLKLPKRDDIPVDLALAVLGDLTSPLAAFSDSEREAFVKLEKNLDAKARDVRLGGRLIRRIDAPGSLSLSYEKAETKQKGKAALAVLDHRRNVYALEQPVQLNEKVHLYAEGDLHGKVVRTPTKVVEMVRAPKVETLAYQEFRPAYYYYLPPTGPRADTIDQRRRLFRDLRQALPEMRSQRPPESFTIPDMALGSELLITATADKTLQEVTLTPRSVEFPGSAVKEDVLSVPLAISADGRSFSIPFVAEGRPLRDWATTAWFGSLPLRPNHFIAINGWPRCRLRQAVPLLRKPIRVSRSSIAR